MHYPVLRDEFFDELRPTREFFSRWKEQGPWGPHLLPLYEWDGLLFVATSGDQPVSAQSAWCLIKANPDHLQSLWAEFSGEGTLQIGEITSIPDLTALTTTSSAQPPPPPPSEFGGDETPLPLVSAITPQSDTNSGIVPVAPTSTPEQEAEWKEIWESISASYQSAMIMLVQNHVALPWKWSPSLKGSAKPVLLETASPFRIAFRTLKSFHGPIAPNDVCNQFFAEWNGGVVPEQITISPVLQEDNLIAFVIGWGDAASNNKETLSLLESSAKKIAKVFNSHPDTLRVA